VLHLPLFAAAAAHYRSAPAAPRLILLDEVFVGVDATNRGQLLEVLAALDLDMMFTSDQEWCTYSELDGIAIHQLLTGTDDGDDAVTTARFVWTGSDLHAADDPDPDPDREPGPAAGADPVGPVVAGPESAGMAVGGDESAGLMVAADKLWDKPADVAGAPPTWPPQAP
jgi:hypothetical protein